ncbi:MAG: hypothetical protein ACREM2_10510, partial [Vulcanimicrobiaceae bacterium]
SNSVRGPAIVVRILHPVADLRLALTSVDGNAVSIVDVPPDQRSATLPAPSVSAPTRYDVVATYRDGFGQETVIRPVVVRP